MLRSKQQISLSRYPVIRLSGLNRQAILLLCFLCFSSVLFAQNEFVYDSKGKRNPFIALITADGRLMKLEQEDTTASPLVVEGIIYDKRGLSYAIVNGEIKSVGDKVSDYQVLRIEKNKVIFIKEGQPIDVKLKEEER